mmetsp:Transcript_27967/g.68980  ORF Transcript_27967/g.68980 Transcript_27967/m.68980 type:complete len:621 (+) Transcript_27967:1140-3002(+)
MAAAANERIEALFPQVAGIRFDPTPLAFGSEPLLPIISLANFVLRETGFALEQVDEMPDLVENGDDVAFMMAFCISVKNRLVKDCHNKMYYRENEELLWQLEDEKVPPAELPAAVRRILLELEGRDPELKLKWGKSLCGSHSWSSYQNALRIYTRTIKGEMWHGNHPHVMEIALLDCVYHVLKDTVRPYNADDYLVCKLRLDYAAWAEQSAAETDEELRLQDLGFFEDEIARERTCGRVASALLMCLGNFPKKALNFEGDGNNGKSGFISRLKHMFRMGEINVSLAEVLMSKVVLLEEGSKIKVEPFKRFTGGPGSAVGARLPYQSTTQLVENHCTPFFCVNTKITYDTGSPLVPVDQATLNRVEVLRFKVTNYESALKLETKVAALVKDAEHAYQTARAHSDSELRKWAAAAKRSVQLSPGELASVAQHKLNRDTNFFDEAAAREELGRYHRVGNAFYASEIQNNTIALTTAFMYMAGLCRKYHFEGGEGSAGTDRGRLGCRGPRQRAPRHDPRQDRPLLQIELVHDLTKCVRAPDMMAAAALAASAALAAPGVRRAADGPGAQRGRQAQLARGDDEEKGFMTSLRVRQWPRQPAAALTWRLQRGKQGSTCSGWPTSQI